MMILYFCVYDCTSLKSLRPNNKQPHGLQGKVAHALVGWWIGDNFHPFFVVEKNAELSRVPAVICRYLAVVTDSQRPESRTTIKTNKGYYILIAIPAQYQPLLGSCCL